jgi:hypothetical protein
VFEETYVWPAVLKTGGPAIAAADRLRDGATGHARD